MADMRRRSPEPPPGTPQIQFKPGLANEMLHELAPLLDIWLVLCTNVADHAGALTNSSRTKPLVILAALRNSMGVCILWAITSALSRSSKNGQQIRRSMDSTRTAFPRVRT